MAGAAAVAPLLLHALLGGAVSSEAAVALRALFTTASVRVISLAVPVSGGELCFTSNLLDVAPLRTSVIPVHGSAAGSTILASEAATFRLDRPRAPQDLQRLNLRYRVASFMCVPIPTDPPRKVSTPANFSRNPGGCTSSAQHDTSKQQKQQQQRRQHQQQRQQRTSACASLLLPASDQDTAAEPDGMLSSAGGCVMATTPGDGPAAGSLTLGFLEDERHDLLSPLMEAFSLAAALAPLLKAVAAGLMARHSAAQLRGSPGGSSQSTEAAIHTWRADAAASGAAGRVSPASEGGGSDSDSATAAEVSQILRNGDMWSWLYDSSWGSFSSLSSMDDDAAPLQQPQHHQPWAGAAASSLLPTVDAAAAPDAAREPFCMLPPDGDASMLRTANPTGRNMLASPPSCATSPMQSVPTSATCSEAAMQSATPHEPSDSAASAGSTSAAAAVTTCAPR